MTIRGIDVSKWQATTPSLTGLDFAFARATYATTPDQKYAMHMANFRKAGIVTGAYHFGVGFNSPTVQASAFLAAAKDADLLVLDLEYDKAGTMSQAQAKEFINAIHAAGRKIGLYHSRSGFPSLGQDFNWVAKWGSVAPTGITWAFWQYQGSPLDKNLFNGSKADLLALIATRPPAEEAPPMSSDVVATNLQYALNVLKAGQPARAPAYIEKALAAHKSGTTNVPDDAILEARRAEWDRVTSQSIIVPPKKP